MVDVGINITSFPSIIRISKFKQYVLKYLICSIIFILSLSSIHINYVGDHHEHRHNRCNLCYERSPFLCTCGRFILHNHDYIVSTTVVVITTTTSSVIAVVVTTAVHTPLLRIFDFLNDYSLNFLGSYVFHHRRYHFFFTWNLL